MRIMIKTVVMLVGFAVILAAAIACFTPGPKTDDGSGARPTPAASPSR
jgi:FlaG/FlaF family flagellin (archaellin)